MGHTDPLSGARIPDSTDDTNLASHFQKLGGDLSTITGGIFTTTAARDSAFTNWVAAGNTMKDGLTCRVGGYTQVYRSGQWRGIATQIYKTNTFTTTSQTASATIATLSITDPLYPYVLSCSASVLIATISAGNVVALRLRVNGSDVPPVSQDSVSGGTNQVLATPALAVTGTLTGASVVTAFASFSGSGGTYTPNSSLYNILSATVIPV